MAEGGREGEPEYLVQTVHVRPSLPRSSDHVAEDIIHAKLLLRPPRLYLRINTHGNACGGNVCDAARRGVASDSEAIRIKSMDRNFVRTRCLRSAWPLGDLGPFRCLWEADALMSRVL